MKLRFWGLWFLFGLALFYGTSGASEAFGLVVLVVSAVCWVGTVLKRAVDRGLRTRRLIYMALEERHVVHPLELVRDCELPASVVHRVLSSWMDQGLIEQDSPEDADRYHITMSGQTKLGRLYGES